MPMGIQCIVCRNESAILENEALRLYRCGACGHVFKDLKKSERERYDPQYYTDEHKNWFAYPDYRLYRYLYDTVTEMKGADRLRILDAGCGTGEFLKYCLGRNATLDLYGVDLLDNTHEKISFIRGDIMNAPIEMGFDVIANITAIEHLDNPKAFLERLHDLLVPGGILLTVTDSDDSLIYTAARILKKAGIGAAYDRLYCTHHLHCFSNRSLKTLLEGCGFRTAVQKNHNHPVRAVDYPKANAAMTAMYTAGVWGIFALSTLLRRGILQIAVAEKKG